MNKTELVALVAEKSGLTKKDAETAALIEGAEFSLYKDGVEYQPGLTTDEEGKITVSSLPWGEYWFVETAPAPGYSLLSCRTSFNRAQRSEDYGKCKDRSRRHPRITSRTGIRRRRLILSKEPIKGSIFIS